MKKETIVLLPGYDGNGEKTFGKLKKLLEKEYEVVTIDYPYLINWGEQYSLDELIEKIDLVVGEKKVLLLGFSMGGFVASAYATKFPEKVTELILVSSATSPLLENKLKIILAIAKTILANKLTAYWLTIIFLASNLKNFPLPHPGKNFRAEQGFGVFGSLVKVMGNKSIFNFDGKKMAVLFEDDKSFPAKNYGPILIRQGFEVRRFKEGGHAEGKDYWEKVYRIVRVRKTRSSENAK